VAQNEDAEQGPLASLRSLATLRETYRCPHISRSETEENYDAQEEPIASWRPFAPLREIHFQFHAACIFHATTRRKTTTRRKAVTGTVKMLLLQNIAPGGSF
jgi:hypothetical protein